MLDIKFIRENLELVRKAAADKGITVDVEKLLTTDEEFRKTFQEVQKIRETRNALTATITGKPTSEQIEKGKTIKEKLDQAEKQLQETEKSLHALLLSIPNLPKPDVKVGKDESENKFLYKKGTIPTHMFKTRNHLELGELLDIIDVKSAAKVSGTRFAYLKNDAVLLEFALVQFALEILIKEGFSPVIPPALIKQSITKGLGYWQQGGNEDYYLVYDPRCRNCENEIEISDKVCSKCENKLDSEEHALYLIGTAEHSLVPMHIGETLNGKNLPLRYVGFSSAFRREAGSYGKDTKGILRVHQFDKVEMVSFVEKGKDEEELKYLLSLEEKLFQALEISYQVIEMCTGDLGFPAAKKYDIEAWMPSQNKYREVTSVSTVADFQSRRLKIRYEKEGTKEYVYILNGTAFAIGRTIVAILENYQQEDGSVVIPEVLRKYMGKGVLKPQ